jgi:hypothetical protein
MHEFNSILNLPALTEKMRSNLEGKHDIPKNRTVQPCLKIVNFPSEESFFIVLHLDAQAMKVVYKILRR